MVCKSQGIATATEVFNEILAHAGATRGTHLSKSGQIVCVRSIAVAIGTQPTQLNLRTNLRTNVLIILGSSFATACQSVPHDVCILLLAATHENG